MMISPVHAPIIFANGQAYQVQGQFAIPLPPNEVKRRDPPRYFQLPLIVVECICSIGAHDTRHANTNW